MVFILDPEEILPGLTGPRPRQTEDEEPAPVPPPAPASSGAEPAPRPGAVEPLVGGGAPARTAASTRGLRAVTADPPPSQNTQPPDFSPPAALNPNFAPGRRPGMGERPEEASADLLDTINPPPDDSAPAYDAQPYFPYPSGEFRVVNVPGHGKRRFPAEMTDDEVGIAIRKNFPEFQQGALNATAQGVGQGVVEAGALAMNALNAVLATPEWNEREILQVANLAKTLPKDQIGRLRREIDGRYASNPPFKFYLHSLLSEVERGDPIPEVPPEPKALRMRPLFRAAERVRKFGQETFPIQPELREKWYTQLGQGVGTTVALVPFGVAGGVPARALGYVAGGLMGMGEAANRAMQSGASDEQVIRAAYLGAGPGIIDFLPIDNLLRPISRNPGFRAWLVAMGKKAVQQAGLEGTTEAVQQVIQNAIAKAGYKPDQPLTEDVIQNFLLGFGVGGIFGAARGVGTRATPQAPAQDLSQNTTGPGNPLSQPKEPRPGKAVADQVKTAKEIGDLKSVLGDERPLKDIRAEQEKQRQTKADGARQVAGLPEVGPVRAIIPGRNEEDELDIAAYSLDDSGGLRIRLNDPEGNAVYEGPADQVQLRATPGDGTRSAPVKVEQPEDVEIAAGNVAEPTPGQKDAGNYQKGHLNLQGLDIAIETPRGGTRSGMGPEGPWSVELPAHYGYVKRTNGKDGDQVDVYIGKNPQSQRVFVIDQIDPATGKFDEHKVMLGYDTPDAALNDYFDAFSDGSAVSRVGATTEWTVPAFKEWLAKGDTRKPVRFDEKGELERRRDAAAEDQTLAESEIADPGLSPEEAMAQLTETFKEPAPAPAPATKPTKNIPQNIPAGAKGDGWRPIGKNAKGQIVYEDGRGVRSRVESGIRITEPVGVIPGGGLVVGENRGPEFEVARQEQIFASVADDGSPPGPAVRVNAVGTDGLTDGERGAPKPRTDKVDRIGLAKKIAPELVRDRKFASIAQARRWVAQEFGVNVEPGTQAAKDLDEALELAYVLAARDIAQMDAEPRLIYRRLLGLYESQPALGVRTSTSIRDQAYSTPLPLAYVASRLARVKDVKVATGGLTKILEPTAGNGALLIEADPDAVMANEMNRDRSAALDEQGFGEVAVQDAAKPDALIYQVEPDEAYEVVIENPPFGAVREGGDTSKEFRINDRYTTTEIDHAIVMYSLRAMRDDGRAVLIIGGPAKTATTEEARSRAYHGKAKREFYLTLYGEYNVVDHFTVAGELYEKQGAGWPVDVIVIEGRGKSALRVPAADVPRVYSSFEAMEELLNGGRTRISKPEGEGVGAEGPPRGAVAPAAGRPGAGGNGQPDKGGVSRPAGVSPVVDDRGGAGSGGGDGAGGRDVRGGGYAAGGGQDGREPGAGTRYDRDKPGIRGTAEPAGAAPGRPGVEGGEQPGDREGGDADRPADVAGTGDVPADRGGGAVDDFDAIFDEALDKEFGAATDTGAAPSDSGVLISAPSNEGEKINTRTAGASAAAAVKNAAAGADDAMSALTQLFGGGKNTFGAGLPFTPENYDKKVKPLLMSAAAKFYKAGQDAAETVRLLVAELRSAYGWSREMIEGLKPFIRRFMDDLRTGIINLAQPAKKPAASAPESKPARKPPEEATDKQVPYQPKSGNGAVGTLTPVNMQTAIKESLDALDARVGNIDEYVAKELGYETGKLGDYFSAEQIDAIALALDNIAKDSGFIIGDQTGIGKGRVVAAMIRYAMKQGKTPIFVTEKPNLYADMYRDLTDIGMSPDLKILMTNADQKVPLDDAGRKTLKTPAAGQHNRHLMDVARSGIKGKYDVIFTTYSQMQTQKGAVTPRQQFLDAMSDGAVVIFDESHNAGGGSKEDEKRKKETGPNRAKFARTMAARASAVMYSSATYAKRPEVMDLYFKTDMRLAVADITKLGETIQKGGIPMQQAVAAMLARAGQYIRRERSFDGVTYDSPLVAVDTEVYAKFADFIKRVQIFSDKFVKPAVKGIDKDVKAEGQSVTTDGSTGGAGAESTNFTSIMHNLIDQLLLSLKAGPAVDEAIAALKAGEKPVITVANTMGSFIQDFVESAGLTNGDAISIDFNSLLVRYLERSREVRIKKPFSKDKAQVIYLTDEMLGQAGADWFKRTKEMIEAADLSSLPVSPIDFMKSKLQAAGYKVGEITGRTVTIEYRPDGSKVYRTRPSKETSIAGRRKAITGFNSGELDALILNQSGATGLSLHASDKFVDQRKRVMIIAQAEKNIDTHMQMLGRVNRTGQVIAPRYVQMVADVPAEKRPAAVLSKKMASLNANTTAARKGHLSAEDVPDFMNVYGDRVAASVMSDNPEIHTALGAPLKESDTSAGFDHEDAIRKVTGRIPLLKPQEQADLYDMIEAEYEALIEQLEAAGENTLEAKTLDLGAELKSKRTAVQPQGNTSSPFADGVYVENVNVRRLGKPHTTGEVMEVAAESLDMQVPEAKSTRQALFYVLEQGRKRVDAIWEIEVDSFGTYKREVLDEIEVEKTRKAQEKRFDAIEDRWAKTIRYLPIGSQVIVRGDKGNSYGVVVDIQHTGKAKNPLALGSWKMKILAADASRQLNVPFSQIYVPETKPELMPQGAYDIEIRPEAAEGIAVIEAFDKMQGEAREDRVIMTGNMLAGFAHVRGKGTIVNFTNDEGDVRQGILMPKDFSYEKFSESQPVPFGGPDQVMTFVGPATNFGGVVYTVDGNLSVRMAGMETLRVQSESAKDRGAKYYLSPVLLDAIGADFVKVSGFMRADVPRAKARRVLDVIMEIGGQLQARDDLPAARKVAGISLDAPEGAAEQRRRVRVEPTASPGQVADLMAALRGELDALGLSRVALALPEKIIPLDGQATDAVFFRRMIAIALDTGDKMGALHHESIHAMRRLKLFTDREWASLEAKAKSEWMAKYRISNRYGDLPIEQQYEEAVAMAFSDYMRGRLEPKGLVARAFALAKRALDSIRDVFVGRRLTWEDVFGAAASGEVGARDAGVVGTAAAAEARRYHGANAPMGFERDAMEVFRDDNLTLLEKIRESLSLDVLRTSMDRARAKTQDKFLRMYRVQKAIERVTGKPLDQSQNVYLMEELFSGRAGEKLLKFDLDYKEPLMEALSGALKGGISFEVDGRAFEGMDAIQEFLYARHAKERNAAVSAINPRFAHGTGSGMTNAEADAIMAAARASDGYGQLQEIASLTDRINRWQLSERVRMGLLSQEQADEWRAKYPHWMPLRGFADVEPGAEDVVRAATGRGLDVGGQESRRAYGRESRAGDLLANVFMLAEESVIRGEKNRVLQSLLKLVKGHPNQAYWQVNKVEMKPRINKETGLVEYVRSKKLSAEEEMRTVTAKVDGKEFHITLHDPRLARAFKRMEPDRMNVAINALIQFNRYLSLVNTGLSPPFIITNAFRDIQAGVVNLSQYEMDGLVKDTIRDYRKALFGAWKGVKGADATEWNKHFREFAAAGGQVSFFKIDDLQAKRTRIEKELQLRADTKPAKVKRAFKAAFDYVQDANAAIDNAIRLSAFVNARRRGLSAEQAASLAKNLTVNFNRHGEWGPWLNGMYLFYNAGLQGSVVIFNALKSRRVRKMVAGIVALGFFMEMLNSMLSDDDDDGESYYDKIPAFEKSRNFILMIPGGGSTPFKFPMSYGYNAFFDLGRNVASVVRGASKPGEAAGNVLVTAIDAFNPIGGTDNFLNLIAPTVLDPFVDLAQNRDFAGRRIMPDVRDESTPQSQRKFAGVSGISDFVAETLNDITGGNEWRSGLIDVSPEALDHIFGQFTGGAGQFIARVERLPEKWLRGEKITWNDVPIVRRVVGAGGPWVNRSLAYDRMSQVEAVAKEYEGLTDAERHEEAARLEKGEEGALIGLKRAAQRTRRALSKLRKQTIQIKGDSELSSEERRKAVDDIEAGEKEIVDDFNRAYLEAIGKVKQ